MPVYDNAARGEPPIPGHALPDDIDILERAADDLRHRYDFHLALQRIWRNLKTQEASVGGALGFLQGKTQLQQDQFREIVTVFRDAQQVLQDSLAAARKMPRRSRISASTRLIPFAALPPGPARSNSRCNNSSSRSAIRVLSARNQ